MLGPHQAGKTTLAQSISAQGPAVYLDLESPRDRAKLSVPDQFPELHERELVILDEVQRAPELFQIRRSARLGRMGCAIPDVLGVRLEVVGGVHVTRFGTTLRAGETTV